MEIDIEKQIKALQAQLEESIIVKDINARCFQDESGNYLEFI